MNAGSPKQQISLLELNRSFQLHPMVIDAKWKKFKFDYYRSLIHRSLQSTIFMFFELCSTQTQYTMGTLSSQLIVFSRYRFVLWSAKYIQSRKQALWMLTGIEKFTNISNWLSLAKWLLEFLGIPRNKGVNFHGKFGLGIPRNS